MFAKDSELDVIPAKAGIQFFCNLLRGWRVADAASNDEQGFQIFLNEMRCSNDEQHADARR